MALTPSRWLTIAGLGCLALTAIYWPGTAAETVAHVPSNAYERRHDGSDARSRLKRDAAHGVILLQLRDRILDSLARARGPIASISMSLTHVSPRAIAGLTPALDSAIRFLAPPSASIQSVIVARRDSQYRFPDGSQYTLFATDYLMPAATNGRVCLVLARESDLRQLTSFLVDTSSRTAGSRRSGVLRVLGPCAFYTAFGPPGTDVERWLRATGYSVAGRAQWDSVTVIWSWSRLNSGDLSELSWMSFWSILRGATSGELESGPLGLSARACAHGQLALCGDARSSRFGELQRPLGTHYAAAERWWGSNELGDVFLSDLVRLEGRDRFLRFWRSAQPVEQAFSETFGMSIDEWTHRWLLGNISEPRFGPGIRFGSVLVGLGLTAALVAIASLAVMRRQIG